MRGNPFMTGKTRRMEEHELRLIRINLKTNAGKPVTHKRSSMTKFGNNARERLTRCKDTAIVHIQ